MLRYRLAGFAFVAVAITACSSPTPSPTTAAITPPVVAVTTVSPTRTPRPTQTPEPSLTLEGVLGQGAAQSMAWSADGARLAVGGPAGVRIYDSTSLTLEQTVDVQSADGWDVTQLAFSPDGRLLLVGWFDQLRMVALDTGATWSLSAETYLDPVGGIVFSPDSRWLAVHTRFVSREISSRAVFVLDAQTGQVVYTLITDESDAINAMAFSPDGRWFVVANDSRRIRVWDMADGSLATELVGHSHVVMNLAFSPDGRSLVSSGADGTLRVWDVAAWALTRTLRGFTEPIDGLQFANVRLLVKVNGHLQTRRWPSLDLEEDLADVPATAIISPGGDRFLDWLTLRDVGTGKITGTLPDYMTSIQRLAFNNDGSTLAVGGYGEFWLWDVKKQQALIRWSFPSHAVWPVFDSSGSILLTVLETNPEVVRWDLATGRPSARWSIGPEGLQAPTISPSGRWLALVRYGPIRHLQIWDLHTQALVHEFAWPLAEMPTSLAFDATEQTLVARSSSGNEFRYDLASGSRQPGRVWDLHTTDAYSRQLLSVDAERLAVIVDNYPEQAQVQVWDTRSDELLLARPGEDYDESVPLLAFTSDGDWLVTGTRAGLRFFYTTDPALSVAAPVTGHALINGVISPDNSHLAVYTRDGTVMVWDLAILRDLAERATVGLPDATPAPISAIPTPTTEPVLSLTPVPVNAAPESAIAAASVVSLNQTAELGAGTIQTVTLSSDGQYIAIGGSLGVHLYQAAELSLFAFFRTDRAVQKVCFSADGEHVVAGFGEGVAPEAFNFRTGVPPVAVPECVGPSAMSASLFAETDFRSGLVIRARDTGIIQSAFGPYLHGVAGYAISGDGRHVAVGAEGTLYLVDLSSEEVIWSLEISSYDEDSMMYPAQIWRLAFSPDGRTLAAASNTGDLRVLSAATGSLLAQWATGSKGLLDLQFDPSGQRLYSAGFDGTVREWNPRTGQALFAQYIYSPGTLDTVTPLAEDQILTTVGSALRRWDLESETLLEVTSFPSGTVTAVMPAGSRMVVKTAPTAFELWSLSPFERLQSFEGELQGMYLSGQDLTAYNDFAISPDGRMIATGGVDPAVRIWDATTGTERLAIPLDSNFIDGLAFSPDGRWLAVIRSGWSNTAVLLFDVASGYQMRALALDPGSDPRALAFSPDGMSLVVANGDALVWDLASGRSRSVLGAPARAVAYSPDGSLLVVGDLFGEVTLLDTRSGQALYHWSAHSTSISQIQFAEQGRFLLTVGVDGTIRVWANAR